MYYNKLVLSNGSVLFSNIISASLTTSCNTEDDITPGSVCASSVDVEFWVNSDEEFSITQGTTFTYYKVDDSGKETKIGVFTCEKPEKDGQNQYKFTAYDNVTLLDKDVSDWVNNEVSFPITISAFAAALAEKCKLSLANDVFVNGSYEIQEFTANSVTGRDLMKFVCQAGGCFGFANQNGEIEFGWFKENEKVKIAPSEIEAANLQLFDSSSTPLYDSKNKALFSADTVIGSKAIPYYSGGLSYADYTVSAIDKVQIKQSDSDVGVIYPADESGTNAIVIQGNPLLSAMSDEQIRPCAQALYEHLKDIVYVPCSSISTPESLDIKIGDILTVSDGKKTFKTWVTDVTYSGGKCTIEGVGNASRNSTSAVNNAGFNAKQKYLEIETTIDGIKIEAGVLKEGFDQLTINYEGLSNTVEKNYGDLKGYVDEQTGEIKDEAIKQSVQAATDAVNEAVSDAVKDAVPGAVSDAVDEKLQFYPTTVEMNSAIKQSADSINLSVSQKLEGYVTDSDLNEYPTTFEMNSAISQSASEINLSVDRKLSGYATSESFSQFKLEYDSFKLEVVKDGEVRSAFAADTDSVTITSGVITFSSNTLAVNSNNFTLDRTGNVTATGVFKTNNGISGSGRNEAILQSGQLTFKRTTNDGSERNAVTIYGEGSNASHGRIMVYGTGASGGSQDQVVALGYFDGGQVIIKDASGGATVSLYGAYGRGDFNGDVNIKGATGLGVSKTVSCQNLSAWGSKNRIVNTSFGNLKMSAFETPEPSFADVGSAQCDETGVCVLTLDPRFAETLDKYNAIKWLVTPTCKGSAWVEVKDGFSIVHGSPKMTFDWMCIGTQKEYSGIYAEMAFEDPPPENNPAYEQLDYVTDVSENNLRQSDDLLQSLDYDTFVSDLMEG